MPVVSARQMLTWLDGRNQSSFGSVAWAGGNLSFSISPGPGANGLRAMVPTAAAKGELVGIKREGVPVPTTVRKIKGITYAFFDGAAGAYTAAYAPVDPPALTSTAPASPANDNAPKLFGSAPAGSTVRVYPTADCGGAPVATVTAAELSAGIVLAVGDDSSTSFRATASQPTESTSQCSAPLTYVEDSTAPQTTIDSGPAALTNATGATFAFSATDPGGSGIASFQCSLDGAPFTACTSPAPYDSLADGSHTFEVRATDLAANTDPSPASLTWRVDATPPALAIDSLSASLLKAGESSDLLFHADEDGAFALRLGGADCASGALLDSGPYTHPAGQSSTIAASALAEGANQLRLCLTDAAGNTASATTSVTLDSTAPETTIDSGPAALTNATGATFAFSATDPGGSGIASFQCSLDGAPFTACTSPAPYDSLADGSHTFEVRATDLAGNTDPTPASLTWRSTRPRRRWRSTRSRPPCSGGESSDLLFTPMRTEPSPCAWAAPTAPAAACSTPAPTPAPPAKLDARRLGARRGRQPAAPLPHRRRRQHRLGDDHRDPRHDRPRDPDRLRPGRADQRHRRHLRLLGHRPRRLGDRLLPVLPRRRPLHRLHLARPL